MENSWVVKIDADQDETILVKVSPVHGKTPLDLDLLATNGDRVFEGKVRSRSLDKLRANAYRGPGEEWESILEHVLVDGKTASLDAAVRQSLQDITQQLGSIDLAHTEDDSGVDLWAWANQLADQRDEARTKVASQGEQAGTEARHLNALQKQLDDLTKSKAEHEKELMAKFAMLLNEKKFELHRLQRVLASAQVDPKQLEALQNQKSGSKREKKRAAAETSEDESDAFEDQAMDVDKANQSGSEEAAQATDDGGSTTDEDVDLDPPATSQTEPARKITTSAHNGKGKEPATLPPTRDLPFSRRNQASPKEKEPAKPPAQVDNGDEETESEADEL
ncbi:uncharacterized protein AB675_10270 [Cyphellophora attinorum]|uniref:DNA repair protein XRCC4 n=1 Tax=Cyphellophora attinorum TaxID=1664694 RepID=A0A0N1H526_9EURO|nr:uncharacterized protein AB675_10270 [Phialophora attinorum]KPI37337.1 hypothetical protein AB675_10270 [Phialophora attinorum]